MYLTRRQRQMLDCIHTFIEEKAYSPTLEEIGEMMGLSSPATVHKHLQNLEEKGQIKRNWNHSRSIELTGESKMRPARTLPLLGVVAAGSPIEAVETKETIEAPREFVNSKEAFALRVRGDSMIDEGIHEGDTIIVEKRRTAEPGQLVVALVEGTDATVKRFYPEDKGRIRLQPSNAAMKPLRYPAAAVQIQGVVIGLMRKYR